MITRQQVSQKQLIQIYRSLLYFSRSSQSGFTIIESLLAVVIITVLLVSLTPVIAYSVATRVQARRVEIASAAAKTYLDGVISGSITGPTISSTTGTCPTSINTSQPYDKLACFSAPTATGTLTCSSTIGNGACTVPATNLYCIDGDGGGCTTSSLKDMIVQTFGYNSSSTSADDGYSLGIRVYRADAFKTAGTLRTMAANQAKAATVTAGISDSKAPIIEMTTEIQPKSKDTRYRKLCDRLSGCS